MIKDFIKQVNSWEDICKLLKRDPENLPDVSAYDEEDKAAAIGSFKIWMASKAAWGDTKQNYDDTRQLKYYGWFDLRSSAGSGSGFSYDGFGCAVDLSGVGARLSFPSEAILRHVVKILEPEYRALYTVPK